MKELYRTNDPAALACASALLNGESIPSFVMDVHMSVLEGSIGILPRRLMVAEADLEEARTVLSDNGFEISEN
ncbi:MAG: DUF2007 domain-containing protein [Albidovulum sp.]|nr:DUF2007 domain-containing protein [Albidovulum sp.]